MAWVGGPYQKKNKYLYIPLHIKAYNLCFYARTTASVTGRCVGVMITTPGTTVWPWVRTGVGQRWGPWWSSGLTTPAGAFLVMCEDTVNMDEPWMIDQMKLMIKWWTICLLIGIRMWDINVNFQSNRRACNWTIYSQSTYYAVKSLSL